MEWCKQQRMRKLADVTIIWRKSLKKMLSKCFMSIRKKAIACIVICNKFWSSYDLSSSGSIKECNWNWNQTIYGIVYHQHSPYNVEIQYKSKIYIHMYLTFISFMQSGMVIINYSQKKSKIFSFTGCILIISSAAITI